ncbi:aromatic ring-hydroxylating oxygenase subunit alpha [Novosphingobium percolationis]|uniref:aromatic ring-hydroxylating oxygenase subunit alpha n=1 Tax=Novosphingobium percolationis TaxID=2871811 RepID=UPI001CD39707|nr:aromatic ring-hydroxylating dioxygenase subunit alpha [Novosphingobium percolationis]
MDVAGLIDTSTGRQSRAIYSDEAVYRQELERVFGRCWLFLAHTSQIPKPNDFFRTYMGEDDVIVVRQKDGSVKAFLNTCTHRGNRICRADRGNARSFTCNYHGWSFAPDGALAGVPLENEAYFGELDRSKFGLVPVAQVAEYKGLIFGCFDPAAPSLEDYLGDAKFYLDVWLDALPGGTSLVGETQKMVLNTNWKLPVENVCGDGYHLGWAHAGAMMAVQSMDLSGLSVGNSSANLEGGLSVAGLNGHMALTSLDGVSGYAFYPEPKPMLDYLEANRPVAIERLGKTRGEQLWGSQINITIFPNLQFLPGLNWFRVYHPKGPGQIEQWTWAMVENDMPEQVKATILDNQCLTFGLAGLFDNDDGDNLAACTEQSRGWRTAQMDVYTNMALGRSGPREGFPGDIAAGLVSEHNQRYFYRRWQEHMQASSWSEVPTYNLNPLASREAVDA